MTPEQHIAALTMPFTSLVKGYRHCPKPSGMHAKLLRELSERSPYVIRRDLLGNPNHIEVRGKAIDLGLGVTYRIYLWGGHRDLLPARYRGAYDPEGLLTAPASD